MTAADPITYLGQTVLFVDLEASSLDPGGYPIEVGWAGAGVSGSLLIRPTLDWRESGRWSEESAAVHRIGWGDLTRDGLDVLDAAPLIDTAFAGHLLVSDAPDMDLHWLAMIYDAIGWHCPWRIRDLSLLRRGIVAELGLNPRKAFAALDLAERQETRPHRAGPDAARMLALTQVMIAGGSRET
jgi:hypothetical protein